MAKQSNVWAPFSGQESPEDENVGRWGDPLPPGARPGSSRGMLGDLGWQPTPSGTSSWLGPSSTYFPSQWQTAQMMNTGGSIARPASPQTNGYVQQGQPLRAPVPVAAAPQQTGATPVPQRNPFAGSTAYNDPRNPPPGQPGFTNPPGNSSAQQANGGTVPAGGAGSPARSGRRSSGGW